MHKKVEKKLSKNVSLFQRMPLNFRLRLVDWHTERLEDVECKVAQIRQVPKVSGLALKVHERIRDKSVGLSQGHDKGQTEIRTGDNHSLAPQTFRDDGLAVCIGEHNVCTHHKNGRPLVRLVQKIRRKRFRQ